MKRNKRNLFSNPSKDYVPDYSTDMIYLHHIQLFQHLLLDYSSPYMNNSSSRCFVHDLTRSKTTTGVKTSTNRRYRLIDMNRRRMTYRTNMEYIMVMGAIILVFFSSISNVEGKKHFVVLLDLKINEFGVYNIDLQRFERTRNLN